MTMCVRPLPLLPLLLTALLLPTAAQVTLPIDDACTSLLVTRGASADGSVMITYTCDGEYHPHLRHTPAADHAEGSFVEGIADGKIRQVPHTYAVVGLVNEHQLAIGETTFGGRGELVNREGLLHYYPLMQLALQRAKNAREAIEVMGALVEEYGYRSSGESISIGDTEEAWILEIVGPGPGGKGALWVAVRIPDGHIAAHANRARIGTFPLDDPENCIYSERVISFAVEKGWHDPDSGEPFSFCETYCPHNPTSMRISETRVWSIFRRAAPSVPLDPAWHRGEKDAERYPLTIRPDEKLALADVFSLMRDHYEGTEFDMTRGIDAGPFGNPHRNRPLVWKVDGVEYSWERPISSHHTAFSFVSQSRGWLPDPVGGVMWYSPEDTDYACYTPFYCSIDALPESYATGTIERFSWDSVWWVFNLVANLSYLRYSEMILDIRAVQGEIEGHHIALQPAIDRTAAALVEEDPELMVRYLTDYCVTHAELVTTRYRELAEHLITRYNDGYVDRRTRGYPESWLRRVLAEKGGQLRVSPEGESGEAPVVQPND
jgi:dipeptidase